jgi:hypothetical protein
MVGSRLKESRFHDVYLPLRKNLRIVFYAPHAAAPKREFYTGTIVRELHRRIGVAGIVAQVSRVVADLNRSKDFTGTNCNCPENYQRPAVEDFYNQLKEVFRELNILDSREKVKEKTILVDIHGLSDSRGFGMILGTLHGQICSQNIRDKFKEKLESVLGIIDRFNSLNQPIVCEEIFPGDPSLKDIRDYFGENLNIIQLEISKTLRMEFIEEIITALSMISLTLP